MVNITESHIDHRFDGIRGRPRVTMLANHKISQLAPYAGFILVISLVIFFLVRYYFFEGFLLNRVYGDTYRKLNDNRRRGFINHHVAATAKFVMLLSAGPPFFMILAGKANLQTPLAGSKIVTFGDVLLVLNQVFIAMYLFELIFREKLSPVAVAHHIGSVTIAAVAVVLAVDWRRHPDATLEFILCYLWGMFDVIAESWPHIAIILYRVYPTDHKLLSRVMLSATIITAIGSTVETIVVMYFWGHAWDRWSLTFKIVTPILHVVFTAAQAWGSWNFYKMWQSQKKKLHEKDADAEKGDHDAQRPSDSTAQKSE